MFEDRRACNCCGCNPYWLDVSFSSPTFTQSEIDSGATATQVMQSGVTRAVAVPDIGTVHTSFVGLPASRGLIPQGGPPATYSAVVSAFGAVAQIASNTVPFFSSTTQINESIAWFNPLPLPVLFAGLNGWFQTAGQHPAVVEAWQALRDDPYGPLRGTLWDAGYELTGGLVSGGSFFVRPDKAWIMDSQISCGDETRRFPQQATALHCLGWKWRDADQGLVTFTTAGPATKAADPQGVLTYTGGAGVSVLRWGDNDEFTGPDGLLYVRIRIIQNGRPKSGKSFTVSASRPGSSASATVAIGDSGYLWQNDWTPPAVSPWDGVTQLAIETVEINSASRYAVWVVKAPPGTRIISSLSFGSATSLDIAISSATESLSPFFWQLTGRSRFPPAIQGGSVSVYRGDELVYQANANPPPGESATNSYLRQWDGIEQIAQDGVYLVVSEKTGTFQQFFKEFASFVFDASSPLAGSTAPSDIFVDEVFTSAFPLPQVYGSEPLDVLPAFPDFMTAAGQAGGDGRRVRPTSIGSHRVIPANGAFGDVGESFFVDRAQNISPYTPEFNFNIVAVPEGNLRGARATLQVIPFIRSYVARARRTDEAVESVIITFDRKVSAATLDQCTLYRTTIDESDNPVTEEINGLSIAPVTGYDGLRWAISIPSAPQIARSFFVLEYDPSGTTTADTDTPEDCLLTARVSWMIAERNEPHELVDVSRYSSSLSSTPTVSADYDLDEDENEVSLVGGTSGNGIVAMGTYRLQKNSFTPGVPTPTDPDQDCSWFNLATTIDPCPPRTLTFCKSPRSRQRHSSLIRSDDEITGWTITPPSVASEEINFPDSLGFAFFSAYGNPLLQKIFALLMGGSFELSAEVGGVAVPQNEWRAAVVRNQVLDLLGYGFIQGSFAPQYAMDLQWSLDVIKASVSASRSASTYAGLQTTVLSPLSLAVSVQVFATENVSRAAETVEGVSVAELPTRTVNAAVLNTAVVALTKQQEEALSGGQPIELSMSGGLPGWTIAAIAD